MLALIPRSPRQFFAALREGVKVLTRRPAARCGLCGEPPEGRPAAPDAFRCPDCGNPLAALCPAA
jgi:hypothetical protein